MSLRRSIFRGGAVIGVGQVLSQGLSFLRNVIVARLISPGDFGIAATFALTVMLFEMISDLSAGTLLIQSEHGDQPRFQGTVHSVTVIRGIFNGLLLFALAWPVAHLFNIPQARWAFQWLALFPVIKGMAHLDTERCQRKMKFGPATSVEMVSQFVSAALAWPMTSWLRDYSALLWLLLIQRATATVTSYLVAERRYPIAWDRVHLARILSFGWPLLINGLLMFAIVQGDRVVIGSSPRVFPAAHYTMVDLGIYSAAFGLAATATLALLRVLNSVMLPTLAAGQATPDRFRRHYAAVLEVLSLLSGILGLVFVIGGKSLVTLLYGTRYAAAGNVIGWVGIMQAVRILRVGPALAALAKGDSKNSMVSNAARVAGLIGVVWTAWVGGPITWMAASGVGGEILGLVVSLWNLQRRHGLPWEICLRPALLSGTIIGSAALAVLAGAASAGAAVAALACAAGVVAVLAGGALTLPAARRELHASLGALLVRPAP